MRRRHDAEEPGAWIDDDELHQLIVDALENEPVFWVNLRTRKTFVVVSVEGGYVTLSGIVRSPQDRRLADIIARAQGALGVDNRIRLVVDVRPLN
jgi:osmotically-inducible protein OsmY